MRQSGIFSEEELQELIKSVSERNAWGINVVLCMQNILLIVRFAISSSLHNEKKINIWYNHELSRVWSIQVSKQYTNCSFAMRNEISKYSTYWHKPSQANYSFNSLLTREFNLYQDQPISSYWKRLCPLFNRIIFQRIFPLCVRWPEAKFI